MDNQEKHRYAFKLTCVASSGLSFIENSLMSTMNNATDTAFLRPFYILLSYNFELILKSRVAMVGSFSKKENLIDQLRKLGHDILKIKEKLGPARLKELSIKGITESNDQYRIATTDNREIWIEDFTKIRYDFLDGVMRNVDNQEHIRIKEYTKIMISILRKAKEKNEEAKIQTF